MTDFQTPPPLLLFLTSISVWCHLEKRSLHCCVLQDSQETMLGQKECGNSAPSLFHLQTLNASSNRVAKDGVKRTEHAPIGKASLIFTGTRFLIWPCCAASQASDWGLHWLLAAGWLCWGRQHLQITALTSIHHSYSSASFSLDTCTGDGSTSLGIIWKEDCTTLAGFQYLCSCLCLPFSLHPSWLMVSASEVWWGLES